MEKLYAAPLEGLTGFVWRIAHRQVFGGADRYFTPFISPNANCSFQTREKRDITQNEENLIPQIITNNEEYFIWAAREFAELGYDEVNFNLGCPSGTVVSKGKGSGALRDLDKLDRMLDGIFEALPDMKISLKTRIGIESSNEWPAILQVYKRYPVSDLIIHPRTRRQMYKGEADRELFLDVLGSCPELPLVYNGDVWSSDDEAFEYGCGVMTGRGLLQHPSMLREVRGGEAASREELSIFHDLLIDGYRTYMPGELPLIKRMKEFWFYFSNSFEVSDKEIKRLYKSKNYAEYASAAEAIIRGCDLK
ncbi:MAG: tRNA-dihydrouridine synthase family protein [Clostridiales bacterium]|nr:tRNA-dihydrouridine synthase family protein [Candidatus Crickella merdequi]